MWVCFSEIIEIVIFVNFFENSYPLWLCLKTDSYTYQKLKFHLKKIKGQFFPLKAEMLLFWNPKSGCLPSASRRLYFASNILVTNISAFLAFIENFILQSKIKPPRGAREAPAFRIQERQQLSFHRKIKLSFYLF